MNDNELIELKRVIDKAEPFREDEESLAGVPWEQIPDETKRRIDANAAAFGAAVKHCSVLIDEVLESRARLSEVMGMVASLRVQMNDLYELVEAGQVSE